jgi:hypothetical protein
MTDDNLKLDLVALRGVLRDLAAFQEASTNALAALFASHPDPDALRLAYVHLQPILAPFTKDEASRRGASGTLMLLQSLDRSLADPRFRRQ